MSEKALSPSGSGGLAGWARRELSAERALPGVTAGLLSGITEVFFAISLAALVFSGDLSQHLTYGIGIAFFTGMVTIAAVSLFSSLPGVIAGIQDSPNVVLAATVAALAGTLVVSSVEERFAAVVATIVLATLLTGVFLFLLGAFRLGKLVRFIPYPVVGGFLAGTGWLLTLGAVELLADAPLTLAGLPALFQADTLAHWLPGLAFGLALLVAVQRVDHWLVLPGMLLGSIAVFYIILAVTGTPLAEAAAQGWMLSAMPEQSVWQPPNPAILLAADWGAILWQSGNIAVILVLSMVGVLLNASSLELVVRKDVDLNRELRVAGAANLASGLGGGLIGFHTLSLTALSRRMGARGRLAGLVAAAVCGVMLFAGASLLRFFPEPVLGGLLLFLGLDFLFEWLVRGWTKLSRPDYVIVVLILAVIAVAGLLVGMGVGLVATVVLFVVTYSQVNVIHHALCGAEIQSNVERSTQERRLLSEMGESTYVLELQGYIFFGTANSLLEEIRARIAAQDAPPVRFIVLDFRRVTGLDSSAVLSFNKARQLAEPHGITLALTGLPAGSHSQLARAGVINGDDTLRVFPDLDRGLEWCEEQHLSREHAGPVDPPAALSAQLAECCFPEEDVARLVTYLERLPVEQGDCLIEQGEASEDIFFIESGRVSVYLDAGHGESIRLKTLGAGTIVGELSFYLGTARTASVTVDTPGVVYRLPGEGLDRMKEEDAGLAAAFHEFVVRLLAERLSGANRSIAALHK